MIPNNDWNHFQANQMFWLADKFIKLQDNKFSIIFLDVKKNVRKMVNIDPIFCIVVLSYFWVFEKSRTE